MLNMKNRRSRMRNALFYTIIFLLGLAAFFPMVNIVAISLSSNTAVSANKVGLFPVDFSLFAYERILGDKQFWRSFSISTIRVILGLTINLLLLVPMSDAMTKKETEFHGRNIYMKLIIFAMLFSGGMIPRYILVSKMGMIDTIWSLVLPGAVPIGNIILLMNFFLGVPKSLEEAAVIDGANPLDVLLRILIPCAKPCIATIPLFSIVGHWNSFFDGLIYIHKVEKYPIMTYIQSLQVDIAAMIKGGANSASLEIATKLSNKNLNSAKIVVSVIPLLVIYPFLQKYLINGIVVGSVKE